MCSMAPCHLAGLVTERTPPAPPNSVTGWTFDCNSEVPDLTDSGGSDSETSYELVVPHTGVFAFKMEIHCNTMIRGLQSQSPRSLLQITSPDSPQTFSRSRLGCWSDSADRREHARYKGKRYGGVRRSVWSELGRTRRGYFRRFWASAGGTYFCLQWIPLRPEISIYRYPSLHSSRFHPPFVSPAFKLQVCPTKQSTAVYEVYRPSRERSIFPSTLANIQIKW